MPIASDAYSATIDNDSQGAGAINLPADGQGIRVPVWQLGLNWTVGVTPVGGGRGYVEAARAPTVDIDLGG